jgi:hypothetical protein
MDLGAVLDTRIDTCSVIGFQQPAGATSAAVDVMHALPASTLANWHVPG